MTKRTPLTFEPKIFNVFVPEGTIPQRLAGVFADSAVTQGVSFDDRTGAVVSIPYFESFSEGTVGVPFQDLTMSALAGTIKDITGARELKPAFPLKVADMQGFVCPQGQSFWVLDPG